MPPRVPLLVRAFRLERSFHVNRPIFATDPDLPPALRTAADLGFTGNAGRVRDFSKLDIPVSSRFDINTTRPTGSSMGAGIKPQQDRSENRQASRRNRQQGVSEEKHTPEPESASGLGPLPESSSDDFSQLSDSAESSGFPPPRPRKTLLERVDLELDVPPPSVAGSPGTRFVSAGRSSDRPPRHDSQAGSSRPPRPDNQAGASRPPRRPFQPRAASGPEGPRGPRRDMPPRRDGLGHGPRPGRPAGTSRPRSARPPRRDAPKEDRAILRRDPRPPAPPQKIDQTWDAMFGRRSMVVPIPRGGGQPELGIWAKEMEAAEARRHATLSLAGAYSHILPKIPLPSDPTVANKPAERAKSTIAWSLALDPSCTMRAAKPGEEAVERFVRVTAYSSAL